MQQNEKTPVFAGVLGVFKAFFLLHPAGIEPATYGLGNRLDHSKNAYFIGIFKLMKFFLPFSYPGLNYTK